MRLPGQKTWSPGICAGQVGPRSYEVTTGDQAFTRNHRHLILDDKEPEPDTLDIEGEPILPVTSPVSVDNEVATPCTNGQTESPAGSPAPQRSGHNRKPPDWIAKYVSS